MPKSGRWLIKNECLSAIFSSMQLENNSSEIYTISLRIKFMKGTTQFLLQLS